MRRRLDRGVSLKNVKDIVDNAINRINTMFVAIVESYNPLTGKITVLPKMVLKDKYGVFVERAVLFECPTCCIKSANFYIRVPYQIGDLVYVGCSQEALDDILQNNLPTIPRISGVSRFRLTDAVVLGGIFADTEPPMLPNNADDLVMQNRLNGDVIALKQTGGVEVITSTKFEVTASEIVFNAAKMDMKSENTNISGKLTAGSVNTINGISLDNHTHTYLKPKDADGMVETTKANV